MEVSVPKNDRLGRRSVRMPVCAVAIPAISFAWLLTHRESQYAESQQDPHMVMAAESLKVNKFKSDMVAAGLDFLPVAHETTGAMGPAARDRAFL